MMARRSDQPRSGCAINAAVEVIASNILADRLSRLVAHDLLTRALAAVVQVWRPAATCLERGLGTIRGVTAPAGT
jgi:hypothetical protein